MLIGWLCRGRRPRVLALGLGVPAALVMVVVGCTSVTRGTPQIDVADAPAYRASVSASLEASASVSSARESERQASLTTEAVHNSCDALSSSSVDAIAAVNAYVDAFNEDSSDVLAKSGPAIDALNRSADLVTASLSDALSPQLRDGLVSWVDAARGVARAIAEEYGPAEFNAAVGHLNDAKSVALDLCDASY